MQDTLLECLEIARLPRLQCAKCEKRVPGASQGRSVTARGGVAEIFSRKVSVTEFFGEGVQLFDDVLLRRNRRKKII